MSINMIPVILASIILFNCANAQFPTCTFKDVNSTTFDDYYDYIVEWVERSTSYVLPTDNSESLITNSSTVNGKSSVSNTGGRSNNNNYRF